MSKEMTVFCCESSASINLSVLVWKKATKFNWLSDLRMTDWLWFYLIILLNILRIYQQYKYTMTCLLLDVWQNITTYHNDMVILETQGFLSTWLLVVVSCRKQLVFVHNLLHINLLRASSLLAWIPALSVGHKLCLSEEFATRGYGLNSSYLDYVFSTLSLQFGQECWDW